MHLSLRLLGIIFFTANAHAQEPEKFEDNALEESPPVTEVTPPPSLPSSPSGYPYSEVVEEQEFKKNNPLIPYKERRSTWGTLIHFGYSNYSPSDYDPDFVTTEDYEQFYGTVDSPLVELTISPKLNFSIFSLSLDVGVGHLNNSGNFDSSLSLTPVRLGSTLALDGIFSEPYIVPYFGVGLYTVFYKESLASQKVEGRTTPALYYHGGLRFQLDWIDERADDDALIGYGLENTFIFAEGRYFAASGDRVPDVSSPADAPYMFNAGLIVEF